jgi:hypothetical protein
MPLLRKLWPHLVLRAAKISRLRRWVAFVWFVYSWSNPALPFRDGAAVSRRPAAARYHHRTRGMISHPSPRHMAAADPARRGTQPRSVGFRASVSWTAAGSDLPRRSAAKAGAPRRFRPHDTDGKSNAPRPSESGVAAPALPPHPMTLHDQPQRVGVVRSFLCGFAPLRLGVETKRRTPLLGFAF